MLQRFPRNRQLDRLPPGLKNSASTAAGFCCSVPFCLSAVGAIQTGCCTDHRFADCERVPMALRLLAPWSSKPAPVLRIRYALVLTIRYFLVLTIHCRGVTPRWDIDVKSRQGVHSTVDGQFRNPPQSDAKRSLFASCRVIFSATPAVRAIAGQRSRQKIGAELLKSVGDVGTLGRALTLCGSSSLSAGRNPHSPLAARTGLSNFAKFPPPNAFG